MILVFNVLSVDEAMLDFGMWRWVWIILTFMLEIISNIEGTGSFQITRGDRWRFVGDYGRLISIWFVLLSCRPVRATQIHNTSFALSRNLVSRIASHVNESKSCTCDGLLTGAPEHDWSMSINALEQQCADISWSAGRVIMSRIQSTY